MSSRLRLIRRLASAISGCNENGRRDTQSVIALLLLAPKAGVKSCVGVVIIGSLADAIASDGVVTLQAPRPGDSRLLVEGRDDEFFRWLGPGSEVPEPVACVWAGGELVGWVDYDVGYYLFPAARGKGYAARAVELLLLHLKRDTERAVATLLIHQENVRSLALAARLGFRGRGEVRGQRCFARDLQGSRSERSD